MLTNGRMSILSSNIRTPNRRAASNLSPPKRLSISRVTARQNISLSLSNTAGSIRPQIGFCRNDLFCGGASELCIARRVPRLVVDQF